MGYELLLGTHCKKRKFRSFFLFHMSFLLADILLLWWCACSFCNQSFAFLHIRSNCLRCCVGRKSTFELHGRKHQKRRRKKTHVARVFKLVLSQVLYTRMKGADSQKVTEACKGFLKLNGNQPICHRSYLPLLSVL